MGFLSNKYGYASLWVTLYDTLRNLLPKSWYWDQSRKTLKCETLLNLNLVKKYQVSKRKCNLNNAFLRNVLG